MSFVINQHRRNDLNESNGNTSSLRALFRNMNMQFADIPGAGRCVIMRGRARITHKYSVEITLYDFDDVYLSEVIWDPHLPSPSKQKALAPKVNAALVPFHVKALEIAGLLEREAS